jgi:mutator protein MutT
LRIEGLRQFPDRPIVSVGAVVVDGDQVLLVKRAHEPLKGAWSLPGGVVELGETLLEALAREVGEETGLDVAIGPVVEVLDRVQRAPDGRVEYHFVIIDYLCRPRGGALACATDAADARWVAAADLARFDVTQKATEVIHRALALVRASA